MMQMQGTRAGCVLYRALVTVVIPCVCPLCVYLCTGTLLKMFSFGDVAHESLAWHNDWRLSSLSQQNTCQLMILNLTTYVSH